MLGHERISKYKIMSHCVNAVMQRGITYSEVAHGKARISPILMVDFRFRWLIW
jgi:hypothetical protein